MNNRWSMVRLLSTAGLLLTAATGLGARLAFLHLGDHAVDQTRIQRVRRYERALLAGRGAVFDRQGDANMLAMNLRVQDVCADPQQVVASGAVVPTALALSERLAVPADRLVVMLKREDRRYARVKRFVLEETAADVAALELPGVFFEPQTIRHYPHKAFLSHVLGFVNYEGVGSAGIELYLDRYLKGSPGLIEGRKNALQEDLYVRRSRYVPAIEGAHVSLTIDQNIQHIVEKALDEAMLEHGAAAACAIVQHVRTGAILAMASRPAYDPNAFRFASEDARLNRAIAANYEPGSTLKPVAIAAALDKGLVTPDTVFDCENGAWAYGGHVLRDYHPNPPLSVADGIKKSSNILVAKVALLLGDAGLHAALRQFGFGTPTGIDLPGEEAGILHPVSAWSTVSATRMAIGQGVAVTALQLLGAINAIANDGFLMRPYTIREVRSASGELLMRGEPQVVGKPLSERTAAIMRTLLIRVTESGGTGRQAQVPGYTVAGKTGTAQKPVAGGYSDTDYMASFVGFLPAEDPEFGVIVMLDSPQPLHTGGRVAAPVFRQIAGATARYLNVRGSDPIIASRD